MSLPRLRSHGGFFNGKIIRILADLTFDFTEEMLDEILDKHNKGYSIEELSRYTKRDIDEVFLALLHLAREGHEVRPIARRI